jgi:hypothetical protein
MDGTIVFAPGSHEGLSRVPAAGGEPALVTALDAANQDFSHRQPHFLPDGRHFLYVAYVPVGDKHRIMIGELLSRGKPEPGQGKRLMASDIEAR